MNGWIKLFRSIVDWEWYTDVPVTKLWLHILLKANTEPTSYRGIEVPKGSFATTERRLELETGLTRQQIRTALNKLISTNEITKEGTKEYTIISVQKYDEYQANVKDDNQEAYPQATASATIPLWNKKRRREEEKNIYLNAEPKSAEKTFVKPTPDEVKSYCIANGYNEIDAQRFIDYYEKNDWTVKEKNGSRRKMKNWKLCLNSWVVNEIRFNQTNDLRNRTREAYIKDVEMKEKNRQKGVEWFE